MATVTRYQRSIPVRSIRSGQPRVAHRQSWIPGLNIKPPPRGLIATPGSSSVGLAWNAMSGALSYNVKRGTSSVGPFTQLANVVNPAYTDATAVPGTSYFYSVSAVYPEVGESTGTVVNASIAFGQVPPVVGNFVPAVGQPVLENTPIQFDVTATPGIRTVVVIASFSTGKESIYDGSFALGYQLGSSVNPITNGLRFIVQRDSGWPSTPTLEIFVVDNAGNQVS